MKYTFELKGTKELSDALKERAKAEIVKEIVKVNTLEMERRAVANTSYFTGHLTSSGKFVKPTGTTKRSISSLFRNDGWTGITGAKTEYAMWPNFGTRYMYPRPFLTDAFRDTKEEFKQDMERLVD